MKHCFKCGKDKEHYLFSKDKSSTDGLCDYCKDCMYLVSRVWVIQNRERVREYHKEWKLANADKVKAAQKRYYVKNCIRISEKVKIERIINPGVRERARLRQAGRRERDVAFRTYEYFSNRIRDTLRDGKYGEKWESLVGYTIDQLKRHIEKSFKPGMSWKNRNEWHIDHIIPVSVFNYEKPEDLDFKRCWSLKNLRPLWAKENMVKSNKLDKPFQPSLAMG